MFNRNIAIDKDDTLNYLTLDICKMAGLTDVPTLDVIKSNRASTEFYTARDLFFKEPKNFSNPPYGLAKDIVSKASEHGFKPLICTKTMSGHERGNEIIAHKFDFLNKYFKGVDAMIVLGTKFPDAIGMVDDSLSNCLFFNKTSNRPFLVWNHKIGTLDVLDSFYLYANEYADLIEKNQILKDRKTLSTYELILTYEEIDGDISFCSKEEDKSETIISSYIGTYLNTKEQKPIFYRISVDKAIIDMPEEKRDDALLAWSNKITSSPYVSTSMIELISYNIKSMVLS